MARSANKPTQQAEQSAAPSIRYLTRKQMAEVHEDRFGPPLSARTLETWPLPWRMINGRAAAPEHEFLKEAERRINEAPVIRGGSSKLRGAEITKAAA